MPDSSTRAFAQLEQRQLSKIRAWADANLAAPRPTMFYMFSGPDFLYADAFYSKATTYVLSALEPVGLGARPHAIAARRLGAALYNVERSLGSILSFSFFITKQMKVDLRAGQINGTLPILYVFLARSGKTIRDVSPIALDDKGAAYFGNENPGPNATRGARIMFAGSDGVEKTLYYFSTDLSNSGVKASGFLKFCATLAPGNSLIKSASYLLHSGNFTTVRDFLLDNSATIIQDDFGIPLVYYNPRKWRFFPFGRYARPDRRIPRPLSGIAMPTLFRKRAADRFRHRLSLAHPRNQPAAGRKAARRRHRHRRRGGDGCSAAKTGAYESTPAAGVDRAAARRFLLVLPLSSSDWLPPRPRSIAAKLLHHRTCWLGTMNAVVFGACGL